MTEPYVPVNFDKILQTAYELRRIMQQYRGEGKDNWIEAYESRWYQKLDELVSLILQNKELARYISDEDIRDKIWSSSFYSGKSWMDLEEEDIERAFKVLLGEPKQYAFFFPQKELSSFHDGYQLGFCTLHSFENLPQEIKDSISSDWERRYGEERALYYVRDKKEYEDTKKREIYFCFVVDALGAKKATEIATTRANQSFNLLKCIYHVEVLPKLQECYWKNGKSSGNVIGFRYKLGTYWHPSITELERYITTLTALMRREQNDEVARRCLTAIDIYCMIDRETPLQVQFLLSVIATEGLLLGGDDRDFLGWKLREKVAILLGDTPAWFAEFLNKENPTKDECETNRIAARIQLAKRVGEMYDKRSRFAHADSGAKKKVTEDGFLFASMVFRLSLQRLLTLREKGVTRIRKETEASVDPQSLDSFIESLKYSAALSAAELK